MRGVLSDESRAIRASIARVLAPSVYEEEQVIQRRFGWDSAYTKAAISAIDGGDVNVSSGTSAPFVSHLLRDSVLGQLAPDCFRVPFNVRFNSPVSARARFVAEGNMISVSSDAVDSYVHGSAKFATILLMQQETLESEMAEDAFDATASTAVSSAANEHLLDASVATADSPAAITANAERITAGSNPANGLRALLQNISWQRPVMIMHPQIAASIALSSDIQGGAVFVALSSLGGNIAGVRVITSEDCVLDSTGGEIVLVDAARIALSLGGVRITKSTAATVQLDDDIDSNGDAGELIPLWQTSSVGVKVEMFANWTAMPGSVRVLEGVDW